MKQEWQRPGRGGRTPRCAADGLQCAVCGDPKKRRKLPCERLNSKSELQLLLSSGFGSQIRAGEAPWLHPAPAEAKRPRFAPGFYEPLHGLNAALYEALESAAAEQQAVILAGWEKFACSELLNILMVV